MMELRAHGAKFNSHEENVGAEQSGKIDDKLFIENGH